MVHCHLDGQPRGARASRRLELLIRVLPDGGGDAGGDGGLRGPQWCGGQPLVVMVMTLSGRLGHHGSGGQESGMLRTSLTVADLSSALFIVCPSLYNPILPLYSTPAF